MQGKHIALIGACLVALGAMGSSLDSWSEALRPGFIFGAAGVIGSVLGGIYSEKPGNGGDKISPGRFVPLVLLAVLLFPSLASAQTVPPKPSAPPAMQNCAMPDWKWNDGAGRWDAVCTQIAQDKPVPGPNMGIFCGKADWEWAPGENRWVAVCSKKSPLYKSIQVGGMATAGLSFGLAVDAENTGKPVDPLMRPFLSHPWAASSLQMGLNLGQMFLTDAFFERHPTVATLVNVGIMAYRGVVVTYVALKDAPTTDGPPVTTIPPATVGLTVKW